MTTIARTKSRPWFVASTSEPCAIGSCTLVISCQVVVPVDRHASTALGEPRTPSATSLIAAGAAYMMPATIAVNRVGPKRASTGIR